jgi:hypothetical protein
MSASSRRDQSPTSECARRTAEADRATPRRLIDAGGGHGRRTIGRADDRPALAADAQTRRSTRRTQAHEPAASTLDYFGDRRRRDRGAGHHRLFATEQPHHRLDSPDGDGHAHPYADGSANVDFYTHVDADAMPTARLYGHTVEHANGHADRDGYADTYADQYAHANSNTFSHAYTTAHTHTHTDEYTDHDADIARHGDADHLAITDSHAHAGAIDHTHARCLRHTDDIAHTDDHAEDTFDHADAHTYPHSISDQIGCGIIPRAII